MENPARDTQTRATLRELAAAALDDKWKGSHVCPVCESNSWAVGDLIDIPQRGVGTEETSFDMYVVVPVFCRICGYMLNFGAETLGIGREHWASDAANLGKETGRP